MLWFLTGVTNIRDLLKQNVRIWTDWPLASYRKKTGDDISQDAFEARILSDDEFAKIWGDLGPVYGKQWRRWVDADGNEHDQIATLVDTLKNNTGSRRMLFHAWNVGDLDQMALPPCHLVSSEEHTSELPSLMRTSYAVIGLPKKKTKTTE